MMQSRTGENCSTNDHLFNLKMGVYYLHFHAIIHWWICPECKVEDELQLKDVQPLRLKNVPLNTF